MLKQLKIVVECKAYICRSFSYISDNHILKG